MGRLRRGSAARLPALLQYARERRRVLFRRRGETDRAIRVHQNLLSRTDLPVTERDHALYELGQDFLKAGLLDRAEETFRSLETYIVVALLYLALSLLIKLVAWAVGEVAFKRRRVLRQAAERAGKPASDEGRIDTVIPGGAA